MNANLTAYVACRDQIRLATAGLLLLLGTLAIVLAALI